MITDRMNFRKLVAIPALPLGLLIVFHLSRSVIGLYRSGGRVAGLVAEITQREKEKERLEEEKAFRETEEFVEREARDKLRMTREGERILVLPEGQDEEKVKGKEQIANNEERANWKRWIDYWLR